jgi:hypothetical protein
MALVLASTTVVAGSLVTWGTWSASQQPKTYRTRTFCPANTSPG